MNANTSSDKTTVYLDPAVKKFLQHKAIEDDTSISAIINDVFENELEDILLAEDLNKIRKEPTYSFDEALKKVGLTYEDLRS